MIKLPPANPHRERWPSGLRRTPGKRVHWKRCRGFESLSLRNISVLVVSNKIDRKLDIEIKKMQLFRMNLFKLLSIVTYIKKNENIQVVFHNTPASIKPIHIFGKIDFKYIKISVKEAPKQLKTLLEVAKSIQVN